MRSHRNALFALTYLKLRLRTNTCTHALMEAIDLMSMLLVARALDRVMDTGVLATQRIQGSF